MQNPINATHLERIPAFSKNGHHKEPFVHAIVETPRDTRYKYAFDPKLGIFKLKQLLADGLTWPYDYGFVPSTLGDDGDPLDILVLTSAPTFTGCLVECRPLGIVRLKKDGDENDRLVAAPMRIDGVVQPSDKFDDIDDVPAETMHSISRFLVEYSEEQGHDIAFKGVKSRKKAYEAIETGMKEYARKGVSG